MSTVVLVAPSGHCASPSGPPGPPPGSLGPHARPIFRSDPISSIHDTIDLRNCSGREHRRLGLAAAQGDANAKCFSYRSMFPRYFSIGQLNSPHCAECLSHAREGLGGRVAMQR